MPWPCKFAGLQWLEKRKSIHITHQAALTTYHATSLYTRPQGKVSPSRDLVQIDAAARKTPASLAPIRIYVSSARSQPHCQAGRRGFGPKYYNKSQRSRPTARLPGSSSHHRREWSWRSTSGGDPHRRAQRSAGGIFGT